MKRLCSVVAGMLLAASGLEAQDDATADSLRRVAQTAPLFASHDVLELRIEAPLTTIFKDRKASTIAARFPTSTTAGIRWFSTCVPGPAVISG
jgi:hypothetical protein